MKNLLATPFLDKYGIEQKSWYLLQLLLLWTFSNRYTKRRMPLTTAMTKMIADCITSITASYSGRQKKVRTGVGGLHVDAHPYAQSAFGFTARTHP